MQTRTHLCLYPAIGPDLDDERRRLADAVERLNRAAFHDAGLHVDVWSDPAPPDPADVDLVVIALWNRLDAPLGDAIDAMLARWHGDDSLPLLVYRCKRPADLDSLEALDGKRAVLGLYARLDAHATPADFTAPVVFERRVYDDLLRLVKQRHERQSAPVEAGEPAAVDDFLDRVIDQCAALPMLGLLGDKAAADLALDDVYVSLYTERPAAARSGVRSLLGAHGPDGLHGALRFGDDHPLLTALKDIDDGIDPEAAEPSDAIAAQLTDALRAAGAPVDEADRPETRTALWRRLIAGPRTAAALDRALCTIRIEDALRRCAHLLIEGDPGAGKTTTLKRIALALARARRQDRAADAEAMGFRAPFPLPLFVPLRHLWTALRVLTPAERAAAGADTLVDFLTRRFGDWIEPALRRGGVAVLLDGLDEVADPAMRKVTAAIVVAFVARYAACRFVLSSRPAGLDDTIARSLRERGGLTHTRVAPLDRTQIGRFVHAWYRAVALDPAVAEREADRLLARVDRSAELAALAATPILLTAIAIVHRTGDLPERRAALYERCVNALAHRWDWHKDEHGQALCAELDQDQKLEILMDAAWHAHAQGRDDQLIEPGALAAIVRRVLVDAGEATPGDARCAELVTRLAERSGLLVLEDGAWRFRHLQFQEYLAGRRAMQRDGDAAVEALGPRLGDDWWWEPTLLGLAFEADRNCAEAHRRFRELSARFMPAAPVEARVAVGGLLARALCDLRHYRSKKGDLDESAGRLTGPFVELVSDPARPGELRHRRAMADALGWFGDPRMTEAARWVEVQPTRFWYGTVPGDSAIDHYGIDWEHEGRWHDALPHAYHIQRWPVTIAEYAAFVGDGGYRRDDWWDDDIERPSAPGEWHEQQRRPLTTPVVGVSWHEAQAWCRWRTAQGGLPPGCVARLPSEAEWVCAARGVGAWTLYSWGDEAPTPERAAYRRWGTDDEDLDGAVPAGLFVPGGRGLWDMAGNVWEWCVDVWVFGDDFISRWLKDNGHTPARVLRGGGWHYVPGFRRVSFRIAELPLRRGGVAGFRCVAAPGPWPV